MSQPVVPFPSNGIPNPPPDAGSGTNRGILRSGNSRGTGDNLNTVAPSSVNGVSNPLNGDTTAAGRVPTTDSACEGSDPHSRPGLRG